MRQNKRSVHSFLLKLNFLVLMGVLFSVNGFSQKINNESIEKERFERRIHHAMILDSNEKVISIQDIYQDVLNDKYEFWTAHLSDTTVLIAFSKNSDKITKLHQKLFEEIVSYNAKQTGKFYPDFEFYDFKRMPHKISDFKGKILVLNYWFIACKPCREEMPDLNALVEKYKHKEVVFISFANDNMEQLTKFLEKNTFNYQLIPDSKQIAKQWNVEAFPTNIILDKTGKIAFYYAGNKAKEMKKIIDKLLKE